MTEEQCGKWVSKLMAEDKLHSFYVSPAWRKLRKEVLAEHKKDGCIDCKAKGFYTKASHVHHNQFVRKHPRLALSKTYMFQGKEYINLVPLCHDCHEVRHGYRRKEMKEPLTPERW